MIRINEALANHVKQLETPVEEKLYNPKDVIIEQEKRLSGIYVVKSGIAKCYIIHDNGEVFIQEFFGKGELIGEVEALKNKISFCGIEAATAVACYYIPTSHFYELLKTDEKFNLLILQAMATKINYKAVRHSYNQLHTLSQNLLHLIDSFPDVLELIPKNDIANYFGVTLRSLNRTISDLNSQGVLHSITTQKPKLKE